jgi:hypothetical protein
VPFCGNRMPDRQVFHSIALENTHWTNSKYLCPTPFTIIPSNSSKLNHIANFPAQTLALPPSPAMATYLGGLGTHGLQLFKRKTPYPIDGRYLFPSPVSMFSPNGPKLYHFRHFFLVRTFTAPQTRTCKLLGPGGLVAHGFQLFEHETPTEPIANNDPICKRRAYPLSHT